MLAFSTNYSIQIDQQKALYRAILKLELQVQSEKKRIVAILMPILNRYVLENSQRKKLKTTSQHAALAPPQDYTPVSSVIPPFES
ncbi:hypothetical protein BB562_11605 [Lactiplantibacillus pentosus]|nr:hypothetical protein BB562_11605 [Lactiplantibacillus pentosus]MCT3277115.1 hypothetical protein [Lactiplantibacillus pentosus]